MLDGGRTNVEYGTFNIAEDQDEEQEPHSPIDISLLGLFILFLGFGARAWGGPAARIAMLKESLVIEKKWITTERFNRVRHPPSSLSPQGFFFVVVIVCGTSKAIPPTVDIYSQNTYT